MTLIDRYFLKQFMLAYLGSLCSLLFLYVVLDVFTKLDEFNVNPELKRSLDQEEDQAANKSDTKAKASDFVTASNKRAAKRASTLQFFTNMGNYYLYRLPVFFDMMNGLILLLAATFTLGWFERQNELLPLLAAGVRMRRICLPIWLVTLSLIGVGLLNRELIIPECAPYLLRDAEDPLGRRPLLVRGSYDANTVHIEGRVAFPQQKMIQYARITLPPIGNNFMEHLSCNEIYFRAPTDQEPGGWWLNGCVPERIEGQYPYLHWLEPGRYFLFTDLNYDKLTRRPNWHLYQSTWTLLSVLEQEDQCPGRPEIIALVHSRLTKPFLQFLLVMLGIPLIVGCPERSLVIKMGLILGLFALFHGIDIVSSSLSQKEYLDAALAAWLPLICFGPLALAQLLDTSQN